MNEERGPDIESVLHEEVGKTEYLLRIEWMKLRSSCRTV